jgi:hypothetical protein
LAGRQGVFTAVFRKPTRLAFSAQVRDVSELAFSGSFVVDVWETSDGFSFAAVVRHRLRPLPVKTFEATIGVGSINTGVLR